MRREEMRSLYLPRLSEVRKRSQEESTFHNSFVRAFEGRLEKGEKSEFE